jgi:hypothetical protein
VSDAHFPGTAKLFGQEARRPCRWGRLPPPATVPHYRSKESGTALSSRSRPSSARANGPTLRSLVRRIG